MNPIEIVWRWGDLRQYSAMVNTLFAKILFATLVEGVPTVEVLNRFIKLGEELSITETVIDNLERDAVESEGAGV